MVQSDRQTISSHGAVTWGMDKYIIYRVVPPSFVCWWLIITTNQFKIPSCTPRWQWKQQNLKISCVVCCFFPAINLHFLRDLAYVPMFFSIVSNVFPLQRWDVPAGKQPGPAELYPEVELAPWWRYSVVAKGREGFGKKQILWIYISIPMVVYKYCIKYRVTHMYIYIIIYTHIHIAVLYI